MFGMNVDVLADNPSIQWYFIIAIPFTVLVLVIAVLIRGRKWIVVRVGSIGRRKAKTSVVT
jgi:hypothetical protein